MKLVTTAALLGAAAVSAGALLLSAGPAYADTVPFKDPNSVGTLGFCTKDDKPLTQGSILDVPFAFKAVSNVPAPKAYAIKGGKATLYIYSPIKGVQPGDWVSYQLVPSSLYTNTKMPMVGAGYAEPPLEYPVTNAPPTWDGLMQIRMLLSAPNTPQLMQPYPTAVIKVTGHSWKLIAGNFTPDCAAGKAVNMNQVLGGKEPTAPPSWAANSTANPSARASASAGDASVIPSDIPSTGSTDGSGGSTDASAVQGSSQPVNILPIAIALLGGTAIGIAGFAYVVSRKAR